MICIKFFLYTAAQVIKGVNVRLSKMRDVIHKLQIEGFLYHDLAGHLILSLQPIMQVNLYIH